MAKKRRAEEYYEEEDTKSEIDSQEQEAKLEEDLVKLLEQISKQQLIEIIRSVSSENKKFTEEIHKLATEALKEQTKMTACILASPPEEPQQQMMIVKRNSSREDKVQRKIFVECIWYQGSEFSF
ncbi:uncharacterized protein LOC113282092 [Papaver somniferum]|uniref:uncharacterized protein LOC113282092 n=1 Tax=Papaver somniferum TaxID=3469 RepID=UPI000E6FE326|nr:uncharacterized protein LOC113282092 [Papaver somniferum]